MTTWSDALHEGRLDIIQQRIGAGMDQLELDGALRAVAYRGKEPCLNALLAAGANPNAQDQGGSNALLMALAGPSIKCVKALVPLTDLSIRGRGAVTACMMAAKGKSSAALSLLATPQSAQQACGQGWTPLFYASYYDSTACLALLLPMSDLSHRDHEGRSALAVAASRNSMKTMELLLPLIDPALEDHQGRDAAQAAKDAGCLKAAKHLRAFLAARDEMGHLDQASLPGKPKRAGSL